MIYDKKTILHNNDSFILDDIYSHHTMILDKPILLSLPYYYDMIQYLNGCITINNNQYEFIDKIYNRNAKIVDNNVCYFNGTDYLQTEDLSNITILEYQGTSTPSINGNNINFTQGYISYLKLSNLSEYTFAEGSENIVYDINNTNHLTIISNDLNSVRTTLDETKPYNLLNGFDLWYNETNDMYLRIPLKTNKTSIKTDGDIITNYIWISKNLSGHFHNNAESKIQQYDDFNELILADSIQKYWYDENNLAKKISFNNRFTEADEVNAYGITFSYILDINKWYNIVTYKNTKDNYQKIKILQSLRSNYPLKDNNDNYLFDNEEHLLYGRKG